MKKKIYRPNKYLDIGIKIWLDMIRDLASSRELVWRLFIRNWSARYKQSVLGYAWAVIMPVIAIGTFMILNRSGILNLDSTDVPYPLFALIGLSVWQVFSTGLNSGCMSLVSSGSMIAKINFPVEALVFSSMAQAVFDFIIKFILILIALIIFGVTPSWGILLFPFTVLPILIFTLGLSLIGALVNGVLRDTANIVTLCTTFLMFLTPVLYPVSAGKGIIFLINPLSALVNAPRDILIHGQINDIQGFMASVLLSVFIFLISWRIFYLAKTKIPERI
jgi:lipopolysaccharide transport system permease protein